MAQPETEVKPQFSQPVRQVFLMLIVLGLTGFGAFVALPRVLPVFQANPYLNGFIFGVFLVGVLACFWQVAQLIVSIRWIERFAAENLEAGKAPRLLAPLAALLRARGARMQIAASSTRSILDSVATRIDEAREITRYIVNTLIFLGLLGTFYGLATTVPAVVDTIRSLAPQQGEGGVEVFNRLMSGLEAQLGGMGVAFASSLLGLAGSLVVGLLELFASHGQNRFYRELEEWLSSITRLGFASGDEGPASETAALASVLDNMAEQMERLQHGFVQSDASRSMVDENLGKLAEAMTALLQKMEDQTPTAEALTALVRKMDDQTSSAEAMTALLRKMEDQTPTAEALTALARKMDEQTSSAEAMTALLRKMDDQTPAAEALTRVAEGQEKLINRLDERDPGEGMDAESRMRLRSIDVQMLRILEEISAGRQESMAELRADLHALTQALRGERGNIRRLRVKTGPES